MFPPKVMVHHMELFLSCSSGVIKSDDLCLDWGSRYQDVIQDEIPDGGQCLPHGHRHNNKCKKGKRGSRCIDNHTECNANLSCDRLKKAYLNGKIHP